MRYTCIRPIDVNIPHIAALSQFCRCLRLRDVHVLSLLYCDNFFQQEKELIERKKGGEREREREREREGEGEFRLRKIFHTYKIMKIIGSTTGNLRHVIFQALPYFFSQ